MESLKNISQLHLMNLIFKIKDFQAYLVLYLQTGVLNKTKCRKRIGEVIRDIERFRKCTEFMCHGTTLEKDIVVQVLQVITSPYSIFSTLIKLQKATRQLSKDSLLKYLRSIVLKQFYDENGCHKISVDDYKTFQRIVCCDGLETEEKFPFYCLLDNLARNVMYCDSITDLTFARKFLVAAICNAEFVVNHLWGTASEDDKKTLLNESKETIALQLASVIGMCDILKWFLERDVGVNCIEPKEHNSLLHIAARAGNVAVMELLIDRGVNVNALNSSLETPVHAAAAGGCIDALKLLWNNNAEFEPRCKDGNTPLHSAVDTGNIELVGYLLENGANVKARNNQNTTPLHVPAIRGHRDLLDLLLTKGAEIDAVDRFNQTPLKKACFRGHSSVIEVLRGKWSARLCSELLPNCTTELHVVATNGYFKCAEVLLKCNADPNASDADGKTPLHYAAKKGFYYIAKLLLNNNANVFAEDACRRTAIHEACSYGQQAIVELLISVQGDTVELLNCRDNKGLTPLHYACKNGHKSIVEFLLNCRGILYSSNEHGRTALHEAAWNGHEEIVELILNKHSNKVDIIDILDHREATAMQLAINFNHVTVVNLLKSHGATKPPERTTQDPRHERPVVREIKRQEDINTKNKSGETQLHIAVKMGDVTMVKSILKQKGLKINLKDSKQATALHLAVENNCPEIVEMLMTFKNVDMNATDKDGNTPLHRAVLGQNVQNLSLLFRGDVIKKVKINPKNEAGETPLHIAAKSGNLEVLRVLLRRKVDFGAKSCTEQTALQMAAVIGHLEIVQCLFESGDDVEVRSNKEETILHLAIKNKRADLTRWILENYPEQVNARYCNGYSVLHFAVMSKNLPILSIVLQAPWIMVNLRNDTQETPLLLLAKDWKNMPEDVIRRLLEHPDIDVDARLPDGRNSLHLFSGKLSKNGNSAAKYSIIKSRLISSKLANEQDHDGNTPLHLTAKTGNTEMLTFLLDCFGSDVNLQNNAGETALHLACCEGYFDCVELLLKHESIKIDEEMKEYKFTPLALALNGKHWQIVRLLLIKGAEVDIEIDSYGTSPLQFLTMENQSSLVQLLLKRTL